MTERDTQDAILLALSTGDVRLFRQNVGQGWAGHVRQGPGTFPLGRHDVMIRDARPLHAGLCVGSSDLIGWRSVVITPDMVGQRVAIFAAVEVKSARGRVSAEQGRFIEAVLAAGGIAGVARTVDEASKVVLASLARRKL